MLEESPFGSVLPEGHVPGVAKQGGFGKAVRRTRKNARKSRTDEFERAFKWLKEKHGGMYWVCDRMVVTNSGRMVKQDLLGFMDLQGVCNGQLIAANVTTRKDMGAHMRAYTNPLKTYSAAKTPVPDLLRSFLDNGGLFYLLGMYQEGGKGSRWSIEPLLVTREVMAEYEARKRDGKKRGAR